MLIIIDICIDEWFGFMESYNYDSEILSLTIKYI
jgi:hypothetical protein